MWPETAFPALLGDGFMHKEFPVVLSRFLRERQLALVTGAFGVDKKQNLITNSLFLLDNNGDVIEPHYSKTILAGIWRVHPAVGHFPCHQKILAANWPIRQGARADHLV